MIPLMHDFEGETVLVVGGGPVGARKARTFAAEASVVVLSPEFDDRAFADAEKVRAAPTPEDAMDWVKRTDPALVVAATDDPDLNDAFSTAANDHGALVNRADDHGGQSFGNVVVPATVRDDPVTLAIATGGRAPALSKYLREEFEDEFGNAGLMAELVGDLREDLRERGVPPAKRRDAVRFVVRSREVWKALDSGRSKGEQVARDVTGELPGDQT
ncbi:siroheme synthase [Haloarcula taiwanensis]|uniref:precorrin-2 dehydrogenase n=1 Tax=Haloarcula taiwanensis TaxID=1932004 RepID=A0A2H4ZZV6_9EURY|nr:MULTISPECIES: bifunctional precorrin-2 dehydrogenase/sirohydrochlorin ferrochelatase [Haloarcula]AUG48009.1 siroheme synthase [Haloarcula taiwanensis]RLM39366.1 bifunctional precorrin-2 dehydrogenase/sirohydrochlorin ferrochelatase [Haloarcula sp. Atlit-120R]RLM47264.1 bifunctional precorrin-2 dehydrogenase/sirohydrochlorin ferrochelatase [Haloarcula sp. Atlit-47R]